MTHKDFLGNDIVVDAVVIFPARKKELGVGFVKKIHKKMITVVSASGINAGYYYPNNLITTDDPKITFKLIAMKN